MITKILKRLKCIFITGHKYRKRNKKKWIDNFQDVFIASNTGGMIASHEHQLKVCSLCGKEVWEYTGNTERR